MKEVCDITIRVPEYETYKIQELHLPVLYRKRQDYQCELINKACKNLIKGINVFDVPAAGTIIIR